MSHEILKGDISRLNLQCHDIYYHDGTGIDPALPDHIDAVREGLLTMDHIIPESWEGQLQEERDKHDETDMGSSWTDSPPKSAFIQEERHHLDRGTHSVKWDLADQDLIGCLKVATLARKRLEESEAEWNLFWREHVFRPFSDEASKQPKFDPMLDKWSLYGELRWNDFHNWAEDRSRAGTRERTEPKPDLTYVFPVQNLHFAAPKGFARDELLQTFSMQVLGQLIEMGISCTPTTGVRRWVNSLGNMKMENRDRSCFPWAVVEMKKRPTKDKASIERCYCQAANGAIAALEMQEKLFNRLGQEAFSRPPPIVAFTCVGPIVKVWLAYQDRSDSNQGSVKRMVCIWTTSVLLTWGVASLRAILMNMHTWASRLLKPKLQACVYGVSEGLQRTEHSRLQSLFARQPRRASYTPDANTTEVSSKSARGPELADCSERFIPVTPRRQQKDVARSPQSGRPRRAVLKEAPIPCDTQSPPPSPSAFSPCSANCDTNTGSDDTDPFGGSGTTPTPGLCGQATSGNTSQKLTASPPGPTSNALASAPKLILLGAHLPCQTGAHLPERLAKHHTFVPAVEDTHSEPIRPSESEKTSSPSSVDDSSLISEITAIARRTFALTPSKGSVLDESSEFYSNLRCQKMTTGTASAGGAASRSSLGSDQLGDSNICSVVHRNMMSTSSSPSDRAKADNSKASIPSERNHSPRSRDLLHGVQSEVGTIWEKLEGKAAGSPKRPPSEPLHCDKEAIPVVNACESPFDIAQEIAPGPVYAGVESSSNSSINTPVRNTTSTPIGSSCFKGSASRDVTDDTSAGARNSDQTPSTPNGNAEKAFQPKRSSPSTTVPSKTSLSGPDSDGSRKDFGLQKNESFGTQTASNAIQSSVPMSPSWFEYEGEPDSGSDPRDKRNSTSDADSMNTSMTRDEWVSMIYHNQ